MTESTSAQAEDARFTSAQRMLTIRFTGSGSEYFRIWIVNLLLMLVTLGFYFPYAKVRRLRYFHANTLVDGQALGFHGDARKMMRGYLLMLLLALLYGVAGKVSPVAGLIAVLVLAALWPALWRASLQFRLANTSWRGLRLRFDGDLAGAYGALWVLYLPAILMVSLGVVGGQNGNAGSNDAPHAGLALVIVLLMLCSLALLPLGFYRLKRYQHGHYLLASERSQLDARPGDFYKLGFKVMGVNVLTALVFGVVVAVFAGALGAVGAAKQEVSPLAMGAFMVIMGLVYLLWFAVMWPYGVVRLQNLVWGHTASQHLRFGSQLLLGPMVRLTFKNFLLTALTLGLYRPFAAVATARLRLEAMQIALAGSLDAWVSQAPGRMDDASGDVAGDFFGIDLGL